MKIKNIWNHQVVNEDQPASLFFSIHMMVRELPPREEGTYIDTLVQRTQQFLDTPMGF